MPVKSRDPSLQLSLEGGASFALMRDVTSQREAENQDDELRLTWVSAVAMSASGFIPVEGVFSLGPRRSAHTDHLPGVFFSVEIDEPLSRASVGGPLKRAAVDVEMKPAMLDSSSRAARIRKFFEPGGPAAMAIGTRSPKHWEDFCQLRMWLAREATPISDEQWSPLESKLGTFLDLTRGWDGYRAEPPNRKAVDNARRFVKALRASSLLPTRLVPSVVGGVGVTFRSGNRKVYFEFYNSGRACVLFSDGVADPQALEIATTEIALASEIRAAREYLDERSAEGNVPRRSTDPSTF